MINKRVKRGLNPAAPPFPSKHCSLPYLSLPMVRPALCPLIPRPKPVGGEQPSFSPMPSMQHAVRSPARPGEACHLTLVGTPASCLVLEYPGAPKLELHSAEQWAGPWGAPFHICTALLPCSGLYLPTAPSGNCRIPAVRTPGLRGSGLSQ